MIVMNPDRIMPMKPPMSIYMNSDYDRGNIDSAVESKDENLEAATSPYFAVIGEDDDEDQLSSPPVEYEEAVENLLDSSKTNNDSQLEISTT